MILQQIATALVLMPTDEPVQHQLHKMLLGLSPSKGTVLNSCPKVTSSTRAKDEVAEAATPTDQDILRLGSHLMLEQQKCQEAQISYSFWQRSHRKI